MAHSRFDETSVDVFRSSYCAASVLTGSTIVARRAGK
jgi:hypothetical protein